MKKMIEKYTIQPRKRTTSNPRTDGKYSVILTGATGSIGSHLLSQLVSLDYIDKVYCFCRGANPSQRVRESLAMRKLAPEKEFEKGHWAKIVALEANPAKDNFGLNAEIVAQFKQDVGLIIHGAWPVNFNISLATFEEHIKGIYNFIDFSLEVNQPEPSQVVFCSSVSVTLAAPPCTIIPEAQIRDISYATGTGYSQSKYVGEMIMIDAVKKGANTINVRIGQTVGDTKEGIWNDTDSYPLMIRAATVMKMIPDVRETCHWLPVDTLAKSIVEISRNVRGKRDIPRFFNLVNPKHFEWKDLVKELHKYLDFEVVSTQKWLDMLNDSVKSPEVKINPATKLAEYFEEKYGGDSTDVDGIKFEVKTAREYSDAMKTPPDVLKEGLIKKFLDIWIPKWEKEAASLRQ
ncbi:hypothetical protein KEM54_000776 [Ascosphaera aggregata]|nr:hypothetical protein KEM54_000776 [Ascosphaera aggregata]